MKTLWLASWYPNKLSPFNGDFIKRHAEAVSLYEDVHVIHVIRDEQGLLTKDVLIEEFVSGPLTETIIYYYSSSKFFSIVNKFFSERKFRRVYKEAVLRYLKEKDNPDIVHVHVGMKAGSIASWLYKRSGIGYVISEHWTGFLAEARQRYASLPFYYKLMWRKVMRQAQGCSAVSHYLKNALEKKFHAASVKIIPNVVNTRIFSPGKPKTGSAKFIHISNLDDFKNPQQILQAFQTVLKNYPGAILEIFGSQKTEIVELATALQLQHNVHFHSEVPQSVLAEHIRSSDALILYSFYETFGCVIIEANACGVPVIVSDIPVFHETVQEGVNGYFVTANDPAALAEKMISLIKDRSAVDSNAIAAMTQSKYGYETVGKQFSDWYREILRGD